ncbi:MAG: hypothetical protein M3R38_21640 [Actinomycetota bacterium]|nr:hypothetical protein [Actinomycetota bacterium]
MVEKKLDAERLDRLGMQSEADLTPDKLTEMHARGGHNARAAAEGQCSQTFELRHCYWCGAGNCVNPAWPVWFCYNGGHPNG